MNSSHRPISTSDRSTSRSRELASRPTHADRDRAHRDRPLSASDHADMPEDGADNSNGTASKPPPGKLGSYQMRQGLSFSMETPKFLQQLKAQVGGNTSTRFTGTNSSDPDAAVAKRRRAIQGESELDDDGPLIVLPDAAAGSPIDARDVERLKVLHPNAIVDGQQDTDARGQTRQDDGSPEESRTGPPVDPKTGKLLFQAKAGGDKKLQTTKGMGRAADKKAGKKKGGSHLLSFDE